MGLRPGDTVFIAAIFSLYMGSWGTLAGVERLRAKAFPFGAGAPGMTARAAMWLDLMKPSAFYSTPSFALHLAEVARAEGARSGGLRVEDDVLLRRARRVGAGVRDRIAAAFGARVIDCGSMAEMTPFMNIAGTAESDGMLLWQDVVYTEVCDPATFRRVPFGERGTPVYTHLERTSQPMIRLVSGDLTQWEDGPAPCGRTYPRLPQGIFGRIDDMFTIRGENVYPSEVDAAVNALAGYGGEHRIVITRDGAMDELLIRLEAAPAVHAAGDDALRALGDAAAQKLLRMLGCGRGSRSSRRERFRAPISRRGASSTIATCFASSTRAFRSARDGTPCLRSISLPGVLAGETRAIARLLTRAEAADDEGRPALEAIFRHAGRAHVVGHHRRARQRQVDAGGEARRRDTAHRTAAWASSRSIRRRRSPAARSSAIASGWATSARDPGVFVRSMATRGALGGLARGTLDAVDILDAAGYEIVIIETVGVGQDEVDVARAAHTTVVVSSPGLGDDIQAIKAGILEIADIHVVAKSDRPDADRTVDRPEVDAGDRVRRRSAAADWQPPVLKTCALSGDGIVALREAIDAHRAALDESGAIVARRAEINERRLLLASEEALREVLRAPARRACRRAACASSTNARSVRTRRRSGCSKLCRRRITHER